MDGCGFGVRWTFVGLILVTFGTLEYVIGTTVSNVALGQLATQTDTADAANATLAVDGDRMTCAKTATETAEWEIDLKDYHLIEELSIQDGSNDAFVFLQSNNNDYSNNIVEIALGGWGNTQSVIRHVHHGHPSSIYQGTLLSTSYYQWFWVSWNDGCVKVGKGFTVGGSRILEWCGLSYIINGIRFSFAYGNGGTFNIPLPEDLLTHIAKSYKVKLGWTHGIYEAEEVMNTSTTGQATLSLSSKGPYRYVQIQANSQNETLKLCDIQIKRYPQPRTAQFRNFSGIAMSTPPVRTDFNVKTVIMCTSICLRQTEPVCFAAQFDQATQSCALFNILEHTHDPSNAYTTFVFDFAAHLFTT